MYPPDDPFLIYELFGFLTIRWYAVFILGGAMLGAWFGARRAERAGYDPDHAWNLLAVGLVTGIIGARLWYVVNEWPRFVERRDAYASGWQWFLFDVLNPSTGGLGIHGAIIGAAVACYIYTRLNDLDFVRWLDIGMPCMLVGQAVGRWGNFFNQEAYGRPMESPRAWGLRIDAEHRIGEYADLSRYPVETTRFHPTFLYESIWNALALVVILVVERRFRHRLLKGDIAMLYVILYSIGRFFVEGLRTDSLCLNQIGGECEGTLRVAQVVAVLSIVVFSAIIAIRHMRRRPPPVSGTEATSSQT